MEDDDSMTFRQQLLAVDENLGKDDVDALKFLCSDFISLRDLEKVKAALDIFQRLMNEDYLSKDNPFLVAELLYRIKCHFLLQKIGYTKEEVQDQLPLKGKVSEYRQMLYEISEELTEEDVKTAMFLLRGYLPKKHSTTSALELLSSLEKQDLLAEANLDMLEKICDKISPDLLRKVERYKQTAASNRESKNITRSSRLGFQETALGNVSFQKLSVRYPSRSYDSCTEEFGSLRRHSGTLQSLSVNEEVKAENAPRPSELCLQLSMRDDKLRSADKTPTAYKMDGPHRGYCLIFNNINFEGGLNERKGSDKDAMELVNVFTWLGLEVSKYDNKTSVEMEGILKFWQSSGCLKNGDCLVCCILSHGESGKIYGTDARLIPIRTIMTYFTAKQCPQLAKKPKLFFIQACQGEKTQQPFFLETDNDPANIGADAQSSGFVSAQQLTSSIPEEADFLLGMATVDGYLSFRHVHEGTWYIQAVCNKLRTLVPSGEDILSILTEVNADVSKRADAHGRRKQMPQPAYTLRKKLIFPVPKENPPPFQPL